MKNTVFLTVVIIILFILSSCEKKNHAPRIDDQTFSLEENSGVGTGVGMVLAYDEEDETLTYSILSGNTGNAFSIGSQGTITVKTREAIDFEVSPEFTLKIEVKDSEQKSATANITIKLNNVEILVGDQAFSVNENSPNGVLVGQISAPQSSRFTITEGNINNAFEVSETDGKIIVDNTAALDFETTPVFNLVVEARDPNNEKGITHITVNLNNVEIIVADQNFSVNENSLNGVLAGQISAPQAYNYTLKEGNTNNAFEVSETEGKILVHNTAALDFESTPVFNLIVEARDAYNETGTTHITINLNNLEMPATGLTLYMPFDGNVDDLSTSNNDGQDLPHNYVTGKKSQAMDFDGITDYVQLTNTINSENGLSFAFWINTRGANGAQNNGIIISKYSKINDARCFMLYSFGASTARSVNRVSGAFYKYGYSAYDHDMTKSYLETAELSVFPDPTCWTILKPLHLIIGEWTHCIINVTPTRVESWINGELCTYKRREYTSYAYDPDEPVVIGNNFDAGDGSNNHFNGVLDELRIYNRPLSAEEIRTLFLE